MSESLAAWARSVYKDQLALMRRLRSTPGEPPPAEAPHVPSIEDLRKKVPGRNGIEFRYVYRSGKQFAGAFKIRGENVHIAQCPTQVMVATAIVEEMVARGRDPRVVGDGGRPSTREGR